MERRALTKPVAVRADETGQKAAGYAAVFDTITDIGGFFREKIAPGAFSKSIGSSDVRCLFNHNASLLLGRTKSGTLRLKEDEHGLHYEVDLPDTQAGRDLVVSMERGDVDGSSFGFVAVRQEWDDTQDPPLRTVLEAELYDVSPVTYPAYDDTEVALRDALSSLDDVRKEARAQHNADQAKARIAQRRAESEQKFRRL